MAVATFSGTLANAKQQNFLHREVEEGLDSVIGWRKCAVPEIVPAGIGETITRTRKGRLVVPTVPTPTAGISALDLNNGLSPLSYSIEQYTLTMGDYPVASGDLDTVQNQVGIFDQLLAISRNSGVYMAQLRDRLARNALMQAYLGGNTRVRVDLGASSTTTCHVDDVTGFQFVLVNGVMVPVSVSTPLSVVEAGTTAQTLSVTGVSVDATNKSTNPLGASGVLTFSTATAPTSQDSLVAANAPAIIRPNGKTTTANLATTDIMTTQLILDAVLSLQNNGIPPMADGTYPMFAPPYTQRVLMADQDFKTWYAGREQSEVFRNGYILRLLGVTIVPLTEVILQAPSTNGSTGSSDLDAVVSTVYRPTIVGAEALIEGKFQGMENYVRDVQNVDSVADVTQVDDIVQILRGPLDRLARWWSFAADWIGGYAVPTDNTASAAVNIPTATNASFKRAVVIEHM